MQRGIRAQLYLPKNCYEIIEKDFSNIKDYLESNFNISYEFYIGEYADEEVCGISIILMDSSVRDLSRQYVEFKKYIKNITGKNPKQVLKLRFDKIM